MKTLPLVPLLGMMALLTGVIGWATVGCGAILGHNAEQAAAEAGDPEAMTLRAHRFRTGEGEPQHFGKARDLYRLAALQGHPVAMYWLGELYQGGHGVEPDIEKAMEWYQAAADAGYEQAHIALQTTRVQEAPLP